MELKEKMNLLAEAMDVLPEELNESDDLANNENWDSLSKLALLSLIQSKCNKSVSPKELASLSKVSDVLNLME